MNVKIKAWVSFIFSSVLLVLSFSNCTAFLKNSIHLDNTSTIGNPMTANKLLLSMCSVITNCHGISETQCQSGVLNTSGFAAPLGLSTAFDTLPQISNAEKTGQITGNTASTQNCAQQVEKLDCSQPQVQNAYQPSQSNPFSESPSLFNNSSCNQVYVPGVALETPVELVDKALASSTTDVTFSRTRTSFNTQDYDGTLTYMFEIVAVNQDSSARAVSLVNSSGTAVAIVTIPPNTSEATMFRISANPAGADNYRIELQGTSIAKQVEVFNARMLVRQQNATKTKIYIPLAGGYTGDSYGQDDFNARIDWSTYDNYNQESNTHYFSLWKKNSPSFKDLVANNPWTFESVMESSNLGDPTYAVIYNINSNTPVLDSELSVATTTPTLLSKSFSNTANNFNESDNFSVRIRNSGNGAGYIYRAGLWVQLTNLQHAAIYYRTATTIWVMQSNAQTYPWSAVRPNIALYSSPLNIFLEHTGYQGANNVPCAIQTLDAGIGDSGITGVAVPSSLVSFTSTTKTLKRTSNLNINSGHRYILEIQDTQAPAACIIPQSTMVLEF